MGACRVGAWAALAGMASGCGRWVEIDRRTEPAPPILGQSTPRPGTMTAMASVGADGLLVVTPDLSCERPRTTRVRALAVEQYQWTGPSGNRGAPHLGLLIPGAVITGIGVIFGVLGYVFKDSDDQQTRDLGDVYFPVGLGVAGAASIPLFLGIRESVRHNKKRTRKLALTDAGTSNEIVPCKLDTVSVLTPWGAQQNARIGADGRASIALNWRKAPLDPLADDIDTRLGAAFRFSLPRYDASTTWSPDPQAIDSFNAALSKAKGVDTGFVAGGDPPQLAVVSLESAGLAAGGSAELVLTVRNTGRGPAFRLVGVTKSDHVALHGKRFSFGRVDPSRTVTRKVRVSIPREELASEASVLVTFTEAGNNQPANFAKDFTIQRAQRPRLEASCEVIEGAERVEGALQVESGAQVLVRCQVANRGDAPATDAVLSASLDGAGKESGRRTIAPGATGSLDVLLQVPSSFEVDSAHTITLHISEANFGETAAPPRIAFTISRQAICTGKITRAKFDEKIAKLRSNLTAGLITQQQFDRYKAQLLGCLE